MKKNLKFWIAPPLLKGDPYFLGHTFMYEIRIHERNSHVVRFFEIKYVWKASSELTIKKKPNTAKNTMNNRYHKILFSSSTESSYAVIMNILAPLIKAKVNCKVYAIRNKKNTYRFLSPTQFPIHGQWWSKVATQWSQCLQCLHLKGYSMWQIVQYFDSTKSIISSGSYSVIY